MSLETLRQSMLPALIVASMGASCDPGAVGPEALSEAATDGFVVATADDTLLLRNESTSPIHYVAVERETAALVDLYYDPEAWPGLDPGEAVAIPYAELTGWQPGATHALVFWWTDGRYREPIAVPLR